MSADMATLQSTLLAEIVNVRGDGAALRNEFGRWLIGTGLSLAALMVGIVLSVCRLTG